jgi:hypothetical protein
MENSNASLYKIEVITGKCNSARDQLHKPGAYCSTAIKTSKGYMIFHITFCDPFKSEVIDLGYIEGNLVLDRFEAIPWQTILQEMKGKPDNEIYYTPSLDVENQKNKNQLSISAVGEPDNFEFYIFYKRPKTIKTVFGLLKKHVDDYVTDVTGQNREDVLNCLKALINEDLQFLDQTIK